MQVNRLRKKAGQDERHGTVSPRCSDPERHQGEHVPVSGPQRSRPAHEEWPTGPPNDGACQQKLDPPAERRVASVHERGHDVCHGEKEYGQGEAGADPETPGRGAQLRARLWLGAGRNDFWFQRHAADWACAGMILLDLRMHRARIDGLSRAAMSRVAFQRHAAFRAFARDIGFHPRTHRAVIGGPGRRLPHEFAMPAPGLIPRAGLSVAEIRSSIGLGGFFGRQHQQIKASFQRDANFMRLRLVERSSRRFDGVRVATGCLAGGSRRASR